MSDTLVVCPSCSTKIDTSLRCAASVGMGTCMAYAGHDGWHWTQQGEPGITRWTGLFVVHGACPGNIDLSQWCEKPYGHEDWHKARNGPSFSDPEPREN